MSLHEEGDRVMRIGSEELTTVTGVDMAGYYVTGSLGPIIGAHLRTIPKALKHHTDALEALAAELADERLTAAVVLVGLYAALHDAPADDDADDEVA